MTIQQLVSFKCDVGLITEKIQIRKCSLHAVVLGWPLNKHMWQRQKLKVTGNAQL